MTKKSGGPYTLVSITDFQSDPIRNFLLNCHRLANWGPRAHLTGNYPLGVPSPSVLSADSLKLFACCHELIRDEIAPHLKLQGDSESQRIASRLLELRCQGKAVEAEKLHALLRESTSRVAVRAALNEIIDAATKRARLAIVQTQQTEMQETESNLPPLLTDKQAATLEVLKSVPKGKGLMWQAIIRKLRERTPKVTVTRSVLTSHIIPVLKEHYGVKNKRGVGYFIETQ